MEVSCSLVVAVADSMSESENVRDGDGEAPWMTTVGTAISAMFSRDLVFCWPPPRWLSLLILMAMLTYEPFCSPVLWEEVWVAAAAAAAAEP